MKDRHKNMRMKTEKVKLEDDASVKRRSQMNNGYSPTSTDLKSKTKELSELGNWRRRRRVFIQCGHTAPPRAQERDVSAMRMARDAQDHCFGIASKQWTGNAVAKITHKGSLGRVPCKGRKFT